MFNGVTMGLSELIKRMGAYRVNGVVAQKNSDLGDGLNRAGVYYSCLVALGALDDQNVTPGFGFAKSMFDLEGSRFGRLRRGSMSDRWFYNEDNVTRDQMVTVEAAMALTEDIELARAHFKLRARRLFFHFSTQNDGADAGPLKHKLPDLCTPSEFGTLIRATRYKALYFLLPLTDLFLLVDVKYSRSINQRALYDADNQLLPQVLAALQQPSIFTETVRRAYAQTDAAARLRSYYSEADNRNGIEPLGELAAQAFEKAVAGSPELKRGFFADLYHNLKHRMGGL